MTNISIERFNYNTFRRKFTNWRFSSIPNQFTSLSDKQIELPNFSTLHLCNEFLSNGDTENILPDLNSIFINHEHFLKYLSFLADPVSESSSPFKIHRTPHIFRTSAINAQLLKYQSQLVGFKRVYNEDSVKIAKNALLIKDYTKFLQVIFNGSLKYYYKFEFLLRTILNAIVNSNDERHHFIYLPLSNNVYTKPKYLLPMQRLDVGTLGNIKDFSFYLEFHILGLVYTQRKHIQNIRPLIWDADVDQDTLSSTSLFSRLDDSILNRLNLILYVGEKAVIYNLGKIKELAKTNNLTDLMIMQFNKLKGSEITDLEVDEDDSTDDIIDENDSITNKNDELDGIIKAVDELPSTIDDGDNDMLKSVTDTNPENRLRYALKQSSNTSIPVKLNRVSKNKQSGYDYTEQPNAAYTKEVEIDENDLPFLKDRIDDVQGRLNDTVIDIKSALAPRKLTEPSTRIEIPEIKISSQYPKIGYIREMENNINTALHKTKNLTPTDIERVKKLIPNHLNTLIDGKPIGDLLSTPTFSTESEDLSYLKDTVSDPEILKSKINDYDNQYVKKMQTADIAKTLSSFSKQGYFIQNIKETSIDNDFDKKTEYHVKLVDIKGKAHSVNFTLPKINKNGELCINGVKSKMIKQQVNLPICKVSEYRVNLASNYNKTLLERTQSVNSSFISYIDNYILKLISLKVVEVTFGEEDIPTQIQLPFEYATIKSKYHMVNFDKYRFNFHYKSRFDQMGDADYLKKLESKYGIFVGTTTKNEYLFWSNDDFITMFDKTDHVKTTSRFISILNHLYGSIYELPDICKEYASLKILDKVFPVVFILGYEFGLTDLFKTMDLQHEFFAKGKRIKKSSIYDIVIPFQDGNLVFNRYPLQKSLIFAGLSKLPTNTVSFNEMDTQDTYYRLLMQKGISINYLKGIQAFFDFFIDPITEEILRNMGEPTDLKHLLIRATELVSTLDFYPSSSLRHHRLRGYERFADILYNEVSRTMASYNNNVNPAKKFSINPEAVFQKIISDNTIQNLDIINPVHELKYNTQVTFTGTGGRTSRSFVTNDRKYPEDGVGILSEATPDSSKVALTAYTSANPRITNLRGMYEYNEDNRDSRSSMETFSVVGNLMPCLTQDDGKRVSYTSIQLSHHVPCEEGEVCRVRTEYEQVIPHLSSEMFQVSAKEDGKITSVDEKNQLVSIEYKDTVLPVDGEIKFDYPVDLKIYPDRQFISYFTSIKEASKFDIGKSYKVNKTTNFVITNIASIDKEELTNPDDIKRFDAQLKKHDTHRLSCIAGYMIPSVKDNGIEVYSFKNQYTTTAGEVIKQTYAINVKEGDTVKKGDVLIYNKGFFTPDPYSRQVSWKHGVMATIALIDMPETEEDGCSITPEFSRKMKMDSSHIRDIIIDNKTVVNNMVEVGTTVNVTDKLCDLMEDTIDTLADTEDDETISFLSELSTNSPRAKYSGNVESVKLFYCGDFDTLNPSIQSLAKKLYQKEKSLISAYKNAKNTNEVKYVYEVPKGLKFKSIEFEENTILIEVIISKKINASQGDKLTIMNANKTIISDVLEKPPFLEDGTPVDIIFSTTSIANRIVWSPYLVGACDMILEKGEKDIVDLYFDKK